MIARVYLNREVKDHIVMHSSLALALSFDLFSYLSDNISYLILLF